MILFLQVFLAIFIAEMGDKTQLLMIALTSRYKLRDILIGSFLSILALNGIAVLVGSLLSGLIPMYLVKIAAGAAFLYFASSSISDMKKSDEEASRDGSGPGRPALIVFLTFFVAEFGDKTQLAAIAFAASEGAGSGIVIWIACSLGLFLADLIGMLIGSFINSHTPEGFIDLLAAIIFALFGFFTLAEGFGLMATLHDIRWLMAAAVTAVFAAVCLLRLKKAGK